MEPLLEDDEIEQSRSSKAGRVLILKTIIKY